MGAMSVYQQPPKIVAGQRSTAPVRILYRFDWRLMWWSALGENHVAVLSAESNAPAGLPFAAGEDPAGEPSRPQREALAGLGTWLGAAPTTRIPGFLRPCGGRSAGAERASGNTTEPQTHPAGCRACSSRLSGHC